MKWLLALFVVLLALLQYQLWFAPSGLRETYQLKHQVARLSKQNQQMHLRNEILEADVKDLKSGHTAIEERARSELGMVKQGETFYLVVK